MFIVFILFNFKFLIMFPSIFCRNRSASVSVEKPNLYQNYSVVVGESGKKEFKPSPVVSLSLAAEYSVSMNALQGRSVSNRKRLNVDAVDLPEALAQLS